MLRINADPGQDDPRRLLLVAAERAGDPALLVGSTPVSRNVGDGRANTRVARLAGSLHDAEDWR
jgi:hypothetical protein